MRKSLEERFTTYVEPVPFSGCWLWTGCVTDDGHGRFWVNGAQPPAHRASWRLHAGAIPDGAQVLHKCDVACCVNPNHLYLGTDADNARDRVMRGRSAPVDKENAPNAKLTQVQVDEMRLLRAQGATQRLLSAQFGISRSQVYNIVNRRQWT